MHNAVAKGHCGTIGYLLDHGANVYAEIGMTKGDAPIWSALTEAALAEAARILFQRGSNPDLLVPSYLFIAAE